MMPTVVWLASIMSADIIITVSSKLLLTRTRVTLTPVLTGLLRSKTGWSHTDRVSQLIRFRHSRLSVVTDDQTISRLIRMTLESQVPPTLYVAATGGFHS